jgi:small-conductance mechanosensitive channel
VFGLAYGAARLFQGWLDARILKPAGISGGVRDSIRIGVGYVGIVIAALAAFSYAGFNLSNLAILAGAFFDFGTDTLNFKVYAFVDDLNKGGSTSTDLRIAILDAFNEAGIAIPFRQTDATPRNMDWLREAVAEYIVRSHNGTGSGNGKASGTPKQASIPAT